jgi:hypothetical protein
VASYYGGSCSTPLPIDALKAFSGESVGMDAHIQWSYVNSKKVLAQTLQQSTEAKEFRDITTPPIVQETMDYEASVSLINGNIFRLRFASEDGSISYSKHLVLSKADIDIIPTVFPNPGNDELTLRFATINDGNVSVELYSMFGNKVYSGQNSVVSGLQNITIPVSNLSSGAYIVRISGQSNNYQLRWVKNN